MLLKEWTITLTYGKTSGPCPSFVFLLLIRHLSNPWLHPNLSKKMQTKWVRTTEVYEGNAASLATPLQSVTKIIKTISTAEETAHATESHIQKYLNAYPLAINWKNVPYIMTILKVEFRLFCHIDIIKKLYLPSLWKKLFDLYITSNFILSYLFHGTTI